MENKPRVFFLNTDWGSNPTRIKHNIYGGCGYYRIYKPAQFLSDVYDIDVRSKEILDLDPHHKKDEDKDGDVIMRRIAEDNDLVYFRHSDNARPTGMLLGWCDYKKRPTILDMDDNVLDIMKGKPGYNEYKPGAQKRAITMGTMSLVDGVVVSTYPLMQKYKQTLQEVYNIDKDFCVMPNCVDPDDWAFPYRKNKHEVVIGWQGSTTHNDDLDIIIEPIKHVLKKYHNVRFEVLGGITKEYLPEFLKKFGDQATKVKVFPGIVGWKKVKGVNPEFPEFLSKTRWDIAIAPLADNEFTRCKSHIKWMEYSMFSIPCIASKTYPYFMPIDGTDTIRHSQTGFLAESQEEWIKNLELLIENRELRETIGKQAHDYVVENWHYKKHIHKLKDFIDKKLNL